MTSSAAAAAAAAIAAATAVVAAAAAGDCGRIMTGGTLGGNIIASQILGWPAGQLYQDVYNPS
jgi:hypothetical protein